jgi:hypothetical protein
MSDPGKPSSVDLRISRAHSLFVHLRAYGFVDCLDVSAEDSTIRVAFKGRRPQDGSEPSAMSLTLPLPEAESLHRQLGLRLKMMRQRRPRLIRPNGHAEQVRQPANDDLDP